MERKTDNCSILVVVLVVDILLYLGVAENNLFSA